MAEIKPPISDRIDDLVEGIIRFLARYFFTIFSLVLRPFRSSTGFPNSLEQRKFTPPMTVLVIGCFLLSLIVDVYPEGYQIYYNWIWLDKEIAERTGEQGSQLFSIEGIVRAALPTFLIFTFTSVFISYLFAKPGPERRLVLSFARYGFGLHCTILSAAFLIPILWSRSLDPTRSDSLLSDFSQFKAVAYFEYALIGGLTLSSLISPILCLSASIQFRKRSPKYITLPMAIASSAVLIVAGSVAAVEGGSLPARFGLSLAQVKKVSYQALPGLEFRTDPKGMALGVELSVLLFNESSNLAYVDTTDRIVDIEVRRNSTSELISMPDAKITLLDNFMRKVKVVALPPNFATEVTIRADIIGPFTSLGQVPYWHDGVFTAKDIEMKVGFDLTSGVDLTSDLSYSTIDPEFKIDTDYLADFQ